MAASLTKEQLKNELISHGISPPVQSARKEEFVKLYEQHVAPIVSQKGDFSSDDDEEPEISTNTNGNQVVNGNNSLVCNGVDISALSDEDLYTQLQTFGVPVGPILDTTRALYQRKLANLLQNAVQVEPEQTNGNGNGNGSIHEDKFSDSEGEAEQEPLQLEPDVEEEETFTPPAPVAPAPPVAEPVVMSTPEPLTAVRKRIMERPPSSLSALPLVDRQGTPTPRPSIHSINTSETYKFESRRLLDTIDGSAGIQSLPGSGSGSSPMVPKKIVRYVLLLVIVLAVAYITYTYVDGEQIKQLVDSIKQKASQYLQKAEQVTEKMEPTPEKPDPVPDM